MAPISFLVDKYRRYKKDTDEFVQWLAETATKAASVDHLFVDASPEGVNTAPGRLKGKARIQAKQQSKQQNSASFRVPLKSFQELADSIVSAKVAVPANIFIILRDCISARKECAAFYGAHSDKQDQKMQQDNEAHQYFISVLEGLRQTLQPMRVKQQQQKNRTTHSTETDGKAEESFSNMFEHLELEEADDNNPSCFPAPTATDIGKRPSKIYRMEPSDEDISFAIYCFLKDCTDVRQFVDRTWREYKERRIPLTVAATTMNSAIEIFRRLNETFLEDYPNFDDHEKIVAFLCRDKLRAMKQDSGNARRDRLGEHDIVDDGMSLLRMTCASTMIILFKRVLLRPLRPGESLVYNKDRRTAIGEAPMILRVFTFMLDMIYDKRWRTDYVWRLDLLLAALEAARESGKALTWAVFAVQTFLDMHAQLGRVAETAFDELHKTGAWIKTSLEHNYKVGKAGKWNFHEPGHTAILDLIHRTTEEDYMTSGLQAPEFFREALTAWGSHFMFRHHPMICGLILQDLIMLLHDRGIEHDSHHGSVLGTIHLYNAALQLGFLPPSATWADLEYVIAKIGERALFVGERPRTLRDCYIRLALVMGISISNFTGAHTHKKGGLKYAKKGRNLEYFSQCVKLIRGSNLKADQTGMIKEVSRALGEPVAMFETLVAAHLDAQAGNNTARKSRPTLTPLQTLSVFKDAMEADAQVLWFDMVSLVDRCTEFLRSIQPVILGHVRESKLMSACLVCLDPRLTPDVIKATSAPVWVHMARLIQKEGNAELLKAQERIDLSHVLYTGRKETD
ncbi:hypothetical protein BU26DRAFT_525064 [Trematosphaeria pertusa]|uniref:DUF6604 domain-containing protein n=1 Tax=Trematosphaeria pertusa TaxID=390896 RepID=A0A6A6HVH2_9PLEO|nr:uncharacterized protein BU26DRAFT_525064 [Trematosphaeria pertusa]KAF2241563.1 hypothetical protein BU26DRAFT_525064 [Trematosphaeria pertusa]